MDYNIITDNNEKFIILSNLFRNQAHVAVYLSITERKIFVGAAEYNRV